MSNKDEDTILVSVCVQTYQHVSFIKECLDGILMQKTNFSFEVVVGEDESSDGTREICLEYANKYPDKIRLFLRSREDVIYIKGSPTGRFNFLENLKAARGKYIAICEGDDFWTDPLKLQKQVDLMEAKPVISLCFHKVDVKNLDGSKLLYTSNEGERKIEFTTLDIIKEDWFILTCSMLFRKDAYVVPKWINEIKFGDYIIQLFCSLEGNVYFLNEVMGVWRKHHLGASQHLLRENGYDAMSLCLDHFNEDTNGKYKDEIAFKKKKLRARLVEDFAYDILKKQPLDRDYWSDYIKILKYADFGNLLHIKYLIRYLIPIKQRLKYNT